LLTNDGEFAQKINHPQHEILKTYMVKISGHPSHEQLERLKIGVSIPGGRVAAKYVERVRKGSEQYDWVKISITEGKNRQIRFMFEKIGFDVLKLQRVSIGMLRMPSSLKRGEYVLLTSKGVEKIFEADKRLLPEKKRQQSPKSEARALASRDPRDAARGGARPPKGKGAKRPQARPR
jgi:23S rRNA pseudouridine2605 synthase